jgi:hypothetical protein
MYQKVKKVPVSSRMIRLYMAISPSMNDQWSGKTLFSPQRVALATPTRSST